METRFEFRDFVKVFALSILLFAAFSAIFQYLPGAVDFVNSFHPSVSFLFTYLIQFVILFFPLWIFVIGKYSARFEEFGFRAVPFKKLILTIIFSYIGYLIITLAISGLLFANNIELPGYQPQDSYIPIFGQDALGFIIAIFTIIFVAPFLEEFLFRGFVYQVLTKTWPTWLGSIVTALLFSLIHFQLSNMISIFILGLVLNYTYQRTKSVWASIGFHALNNAIAFGLDSYLYFNPEILEQLEITMGFL